MCRRRERKRGGDESSLKKKRTSGYVIVNGQRLSKESGHKTLSFKSDVSNWSLR